MAVSLGLFAFFYDHGGEHGLTELADEPLTLNQEGVVDIVSAAQHGLAVGHTLGQDHVGIVKGLFGLHTQLIDLGTGDPVAVSDHREGNAHSLGIFQGGIVLGNVAPDAEGDLQMGILCCDGLSFSFLYS